MFWPNFYKRLLISVRDLESLVWILIFPVILGTLFFFTFSGLDTIGELRTFPVGIVDDDVYLQDSTFRMALESVSGECGLFELSVFADAAEANRALENGDIEGYILAGDTPKLIVTDDGINQTIAKGFLDRYMQTRSSVERILEADPQALHILPELLAPQSYTEQISLSHNPPTNRVNYFYALLAMVCMYGGFQGLASVTYLQANLSPLGVRRTLSPVRRWRMILPDILGGIAVNFVCLLVVIVYITFVLGIDFGPQLWAVMVTCLAGSMLGVSFGTMVSAVSRLKEMAKIAIVVTVTMVCSFLSGLMVGGINYIIAENAPVIAWINPAARITDAFYSLYFYDTYERYLLNIAIVLAMTVVMFLITAIFLRRQRYESI